MFDGKKYKFYVGHDVLGPRGGFLKMFDGSSRSDGRRPTTGLIDGRP